MATNFPTSLDNPTTKNDGDTVFAAHVDDLQSAVVALETKVGVDNSAVTTSQDYILKHLPVGNISATGTPSSSTFLRGDGAWAAALAASFGDGSDGDVTVSGTTTLTRDMYYNNLTVTGTLVTNGYKVYVKGTLSGNGTIKFPDGAAGTNAVGNTGGSGGAALAGGGPFVNKAGGNGGSGGGALTAPTAGGSSTSSPATAGTIGGTGGTGVNGAATVGGAGGTVSIIMKLGIIALFTILGVDFSATPAFVWYTGSAGSGGGSTGGPNNTPKYGGGGGGGGAGGGLVWLIVNTWAGTFTIQAVGGAGGNGGDAVDSGAAGGGGGSGGPGGASVVIYGTKTWTGSYNLVGGAKGTKGSGSGSGTVGSDGSVGTTSTAIYEYAMSTLTR